MFFRAPSNMFAYTIMHLIFCAPKIVVHGFTDANAYLAVHLLQRNILDYKVNLMSIPLTINPEPSLGIQVVFL